MPPISNSRWLIPRFITEGLAIIKALQHWRHWLEGTKIPVEILMDHKNLQYFTKPRILNRRQLRWMDLLAHYNYEISYRPGNQNGAADALSRKEELAPIDPEEEHPTTLFPLDKFRNIAVEIAHLNDQEYIEVIVAILEEAVMSDEMIQEKIRKSIPHAQLLETVVLQNGLPYQDEWIYITNDVLKNQVLCLYHDSPIAGHLGQQGTLELVQ